MLKRLSAKAKAWWSSKGSVQADELSLYERTARAYEGLSAPDPSIYRDIRLVPTYHKSITEHIALLRQANYCLLEHKLFAANDWKELLVPRHQWFRDKDQSYLDLDHVWGVFLEQSCEFLRNYEKEQDCVDGLSQTNLYRMGPIVDIVRSISRSWE